MAADVWLCTRACLNDAEELVKDAITANANVGANESLQHVWTARQAQILPVWRSDIIELT